MSNINSYRDLIVWQKAMDLVTNVYAVSKNFPSDELYSLTSQIRRSAISIPGNIAEGYGRNATGDYKRFLQIAAGSLFELQTQIEISFNLKYINGNLSDEMFKKTKELERMLLSLIRKIN